MHGRAASGNNKKGVCVSLPLSGASLLEFTSWSQNIPSPCLAASLPFLSRPLVAMAISCVTRMLQGGGPVKGLRNVLEDRKEVDGGSVKAVFINS